MARKIKESPLNLIQILPPKNGQSPSKPYSLASTHFKLQIDAEEPTGWMLLLARVVAGTAYLFRSIGSVRQSGFDQGQRATWTRKQDHEGGHNTTCHLPTENRPLDSCPFYLVCQIFKETESMDSHDRQTCMDEVDENETKISRFKN